MCRKNFVDPRKFAETIENIASEQASCMVENIVLCGVRFYIVRSI